MTEESLICFGKIPCSGEREVNYVCFSEEEYIGRHSLRIDVGMGSRLQREVNNVRYSGEKYR